MKYVKNSVFRICFVLCAFVLVISCSGLSQQIVQRKQVQPQGCLQRLVWLFVKSSYDIPEIEVMRMDVQPGQSLKLSRARLHNDSAFVIALTMEDRSQQVISAMCPYTHIKGDKPQFYTLEQKLNIVQDYLGRQNKKVKQAQAVLVGVNGDEHNSFPVRDQYWNAQIERFKKLGIQQVQFVPVQLVPGADFRDVNHFEVTVGSGGMSGSVASRGQIKEFSIPCK